jgi:hypothetical protein
MHSCILQLLLPGNVLVNNVPRTVYLKTQPSLSTHKRIIFNGFQRINCC